VKITPNDLGVPERDMEPEDVRQTLERIKSMPAATNHSFAAEYIDAVTVEDRRVTVRTTRPYAWFLNRIGLYFNAIAPRELYEGDTDRLTNAAAGAGPLRLRRVAENDAAAFDRNPNFYRRDPANNNAQLPYVDGLDVRVIFDRATLRTGFQSGQIHAYMTGSGAEARGLTDAVIARDPFFAFIAFTMNHQRAPFGDPRVRRAVARAINRQAFVDLVYGGDAQADGIVQWSLGAYALPPEELAQLQPFNLEEARSLVREVGGIRFPMVYPAETPVLEHNQHLPIFIEQMRAAGIEIDLVPQDFGLWVETLQKLDYTATLNLNQIYETPEIPLDIHTESGPFGDGTYLRGLGDPDIERAVEKVAESLDYDERVEAVHEAQRVIYEKDPVSLPLVTPYLHMAWSKKVKNIPAGIGTSSYMVNTYWMDV
jgi:peptide/nickel transport system substrate-binding protein